MANLARVFRARSAVSLVRAKNRGIFRPGMNVLYYNDQMVKRSNAFVNIRAISSTPSLCHSASAPAGEIRTGILDGQEYANVMSSPIELDAETVKTVMESVPLVDENISEITQVFYPRMFDKNPEMMYYFNEANQRQHMQQKAIGRAMILWGKSLDNPEKFDGLLEVITHRHVGLFVTPDMYFNIYSNFLHSMQKVLGEKFTPEMLTAWSSAIMSLSQRLIGSEAALAHEYENRMGGWLGERQFELIKKMKVAETTIQFTFAPTDVMPWHQNAEDNGIEFTPGQYLTIRLPGTGLSPRHYTITSPPKSNVLQITSRLVPDGAVSTYMHEEFQVGDRCLLGVPCGLFTPFPDRDIVMISAGIGITPMYSFLTNTDNSKIKGFLHFDKAPERMPFRVPFEKSTIDKKIIYTGGERYANEEDVKKETAVLAIRAGLTDADYYVSGPPDFMVLVEKVLRGHGVKNIYCQVFGTGTKPMSCPFHS